MKSLELKDSLNCAVDAARQAGQLMKKNFWSAKKINVEQQHDIKLELDVRCQKLIEKRLRSSFPNIPVLGEEGVLGDQDAPVRWVVDPIDGTVNFSYGIPHACVSIALQTRSGSKKGSKRNASEEFESVVGVVYDPFCDEVWTAIRGQPARLNGRLIRASNRANLDQAIVSMGFAKYAETLEIMLPAFNSLVHRVRKIRMMGAAALSMVYVASGRFDAYIESGVRLWDIAAGGLILECAGGEFWREQIEGEHTYRINANNGFLRKKLERYARFK